jgi:UDP-glucose 4-epimerase
MAHFLVTGGCGFIGSHLADTLIENGHDVRVLDNLSTGKLENLAPKAEFLEGDITNADTVPEAMSGMDGVFHLAAVSSVSRTMTEWRECHTINLTGAINIFDAASRVPGGPIPVVYASSAAVYGNCQATKLNETSPTDPISAYGADKLGCELHARVATRQHGVPTLGLRLFNVYGPRQDPTSPYAGVISIFADRARRNLPLEICGDGEQVRDFVFVRDAVKFFVSAMGDGRARGQVYNVCTGRGIGIGNLADMIGELIGGTPERRYKPPRAGDIRHSVGNPDSALAGLGCRADTPIRHGLAQTLRDLVNT